MAALIAGLVRDLPALRTGALVLVGIALAKVFLYDLATLTAMARVASFLALGLLLLAGAFAWQRIRPRPLPDLTGGAARRARLTPRLTSPLVRRARPPRPRRCCCSLAPAQAQAGTLPRAPGRADVTPPTGYYAMGWVRSDVVLAASTRGSSRARSCSSATAGRSRWSPPTSAAIAGGVVAEAADG